MDLDQAVRAVRELVSVVRALRTPGTGCPWDLEQDHRSLRPYLLEEACEVLDALDRGDDGAFREELGDLLLQVVLHAQVADDRGAFSITEVARGITEKMVRRHPHVFGPERASDADEVRRNWEQIKAAEVRDKGAAPPSPAAGLARLPKGLPALLRAQRLGEKAARVHFDWDSLAAVLGKVRAEFAELEQELGAAVDDHPEVTAPPAGARGLPEGVRRRLEHELGDLVFSLCQLARWLGLSAEDSLRACTTRFVDRFRHMEERQAPRSLQELSREEREAAWRRAKEAQGPAPGDPPERGNAPA
jgi:MazG family protein